MPYGLYISAEGAQAQSRRLEVIANNLANVDTPGFKRDLALFQARFAEATQRGSDYHGSGTINDVGGGVAFQETVTEYGQGPARETGNPTDMAIDGDGFFLVGRDGEEFLTRAGNFYLDENGFLLTQSNHSVLSDAGSPIQVDTTLGPLTITSDGSVQQGDTSVPLALVKPRTPGDLTKAGESLFRPTGPVEPVAANERRVQQHFVEGSGVNPTMEMMEMISASRSFEANVQLIKHQDEMLGSLISRVLRIS